MLDGLLGGPAVQESLAAEEHEVWIVPVLREQRLQRERSLLVRIHFIILMIRWTGLAPWEFELRL